jgi:hypothetical protein
MVYTNTVYQYLSYDRRRYEKVVSADLILPALTATSSHFAALALQSRKLLNATTNIAPPIETDLLAVLEQVSTLSANVAIELASAIRSADKVTAGLVATSTLALLGFYERITMATTSLLFDHVATLNGQDDVEKLDIKVSDLRVSLSNRTDGVFGDVLGFLSTRRDTSGLVSVLKKFTKDMALLDESLARFLSRADTMLLTQRHGPFAADRVIPDESLWQLSGLMTGTVVTVVHSTQSITMGNSVDDIGVNRVLVSALGLTMKRVDSILNQAVKTLNSMFRFQTINNSKLTINTTTPAVQGNTLLWFIACSVGIEIPGPLGLNSCWIILSAWLVLAVATLPIWLPLVILGSIFGTGGGGSGQLRINNAAVQHRIQCQREALSCQTNALSAALPST